MSDETAKEEGLSERGVQAVVPADVTAAGFKSVSATILAVLQNQWFHDPDRVRRLIERSPESRSNIIRYALFAGCKTGRVLKQVFGNLCDEILWEEASPQIGGHAASVFPADHAHLLAAYLKADPCVVLAFGKIASDELATIVPSDRLIVGPHPTARGADTLQRLRDMRAKYYELKSQQEPSA